jgi:putative heme-binding domain-containing protein
VQALYVLQGFPVRSAQDILTALNDPDAHVREHALRLAERWHGDVAIQNRVLAMSTETDAHVRYQLGFTLGAFDGVAFTNVLRRMAIKEASDPWMRLAILTSAHSRRGSLFRAFVIDNQLPKTVEGKVLLNALAVQIGAANQQDELAEFLAAIDRLPAGEGREYMASLMSKLPAKSRERITKAGKAGELYKELVVEAIKTSSNEKSPLTERVSGVRTLGLAEFAKVKPNFANFLQVRQPEAVQKAALETLLRFEDAGVPDLVIDAWPSLSPQVRATAAETLFARPVWLNAFLDAVEKDKIKTGEIDPARIKLLQVSADAKIRDRAEKLFKGTALSKRKDVVDAYQKSLALKGDLKNGRELFKKNCAACHRIEGVGEQIGAELGALRDRGPDFILLNVLDPNREVLPKFITYVVTTDAGRQITGMIQAETATSITIRKPDGTNETVLRVNIEELRSTGLSFMPEGLEKSINHQEMADLIGYLMSAN